MALHNIAHNIHSGNIHPVASLLGTTVQVKAAQSNTKVLLYYFYF